MVLPSRALRLFSLLTENGAGIKISQVLATAVPFGLYIRRVLLR